MSHRPAQATRRQLKNRQQLTAYIVERVQELGLTWEELATSSRLSTTWLRQIRNNHQKNVTRDTAQRLDTALQWEPGSTMGIIENGTPPTIADSGRRAGGLTSDPTSQGERSHNDSVAAVISYWGRRFKLTASDYGQLAADLTRIREEGYEAGRRRAQDARKRRE